MNIILRRSFLPALIGATVSLTALIGCGSDTTALAPTSEVPTPTTSKALVELATSETSIVAASMPIPEMSTPDGTEAAALSESNSAVRTASFEFPEHVAIAVATAKVEAARLLADTPRTNPTVGCDRLCDSDFWGTYNFRTRKYENIAEAFEVKSEIERGADVNAQEAQGSTPLCKAVLLPNPILTALLLEQGADPNVGNCSRGSSPLHFAVQNSDPYAAEVVVALLLDYGADVDVDVNGWMPLHAAAAWGGAPVTELLLNWSADVNATNNHAPFGEGDDGWSAVGAQPLHISAGWNDDPEVTALLLDWGADIDGPADYASPLYIAARESRNPAVVSLLVDKGADVRAGVNGWTPLHSSASYAIEGNRKERNGEIIELLLENGADVNARSEFGTTPLHRAVTPYADRKVIELLFQQGADVNASDVRGYSPLHLVIAEQHPDSEIIQLLLSNGADVNARAVDGSTPLHLVVGSHDPDLWIVELLLDNGADVTARTNDGATACTMVEETFYSLSYQVEDIRSLVCKRRR